MERSFAESFSMARHSVCSKYLVLVLSQRTKVPNARLLVFPNENEHLAALTQSEIQDVMWVHQASKEIRKKFLRAYFISPSDVGAQVQRAVCHCSSWDAIH